MKIRFEIRIEQIFCFTFNRKMANRFKASIPAEGEQKDEVTTIKRALAATIRPQYRQQLIEKITDLSLRATTIRNLASLLFLLEVEKAYEHRRRNRRLQFLRQQW